MAPHTAAPASGRAGGGTGFGSRARPGPPVRTRGPNCGAGQRSSSAVPQPVSAIPGRLSRCPLSATPIPPPQELRSGSDAMGPGPAGSPTHTGRETC
jgi:hypothetical protein